MIDRDIILRDRTYLAFLFLGCVVKFQAREANSWGRRASLNPGNRVCVLFLYLPTFRIFFSFTFTFIIKLVKPIRQHSSCSKKYILMIG